MEAKWQRARQSRLLQAFVLFYLLHIVGLLWSGDLLYGLDDLRKKLPLLVLPLVVLTTEAPSRREKDVVMGVYVAAVAVASLIGLVRWLTIDDLAYRDIIPFISHIRFSLNLSFCICLMAVCLWREYATRCRVWVMVSAALLALWFLFFLLLLQSFTGVVALYTGVLAALVVWWRDGGAQRRTRVWLVAGWLAVLAAATGVVWYYVDSYFRLQPLSEGVLQQYTVNGNPYKHERDGFIENGNYVNNYICDSELRSEWQKVGSLPIESITQNGYAVYPTLVRYLNAMGCTKDSVGMSHLLPADVAAIERGVANPVYLKRVSLRRMCYVMCFEYESWRCYGSVVDFTVLQRLELWRAGWEVFKRHWLIGTGTGDVVNECHKQLCEMGSPLAGTTKHTHSQYLTLLITFGVVGFVVLSAGFVRAALRRRGRGTAPVTVALVVMVLVSFITEDTLETLAGCLFAVFPLLMMMERDEGKA